MHIEHTTYDAARAPPPYQKRKTRPHTAPATPSSVAVAPTDAPLSLHRSLIIGNRRRPPSRSAAHGSSRSRGHKGRASKGDHHHHHQQGRPPWGEVCQYLKSKISTFVEGCKAEPADPSVWELYKGYRRDRKLWKEWRSQQRLEDKKRRISSPRLLTSDWDGGGGGGGGGGGKPPPARQRQRQSQPSSAVLGAGRETRLGDFIGPTSKEKYLNRRWGGRKGVVVDDDDDASFYCVGVVDRCLTPAPAQQALAPVPPPPPPSPSPPPPLPLPSSPPPPPPPSTSPPPPLPPLPLRIPRSKGRPPTCSIYSPLACGICCRPTRGDYYLVVCRDCAGAFPSLMPPRGPSSTDASPRRPSSKTMYTSTSDPPGTMTQAPEEVPIMYSPPLDSLQLRSPKSQSVDDSGKRYRREAQLYNSMGTAKLKTPTKRTGGTLGGVPTRPPMS
ncbi:hypothetical protein GP486_008379 [Trichoglossum hirsutum]|uniref:Uncharacterized protein n=1 Tax=Trichoglossum hirsutum TaxID=265104 RepID=A0A9P8I4Q3_9PEZI|nr:hypothetical protein GP486_008379 [Trichoglossum hirsutum]